MARQQRSATFTPESTPPSLGLHSTPESALSTTKIQKCSSPNCVSMQDGEAGKSLKSSQTKGCRAARSRGRRSIG